MRLLGISLFAILVLGIGLSITRQWGLSQRFAPYETAFFKENLVRSYLQITQLEDLKSEFLNDPSIGYYLPVRMTLDHVFVVAEQTEPQPTFRFPLQEILIRQPNLKTLDLFLEKLKDRRLILNFSENAADVDLEILKKIPQSLMDKNILFSSPVEVITENLRKKAPLATYGSSQSDVMRFMSFESLYLHPASPFRKDVYLTPLQILNRPAVNLEVVREMKRRYKKVILGPIKTQAEFDAARQLGPDAIIFQSAELYQQLKAQIQTQ